MTPSRLRRRRRTTRPAASSPTTPQLFLPRSTPSTAICMTRFPFLRFPPRRSAAGWGGGQFHKPPAARRHSIPTARYRVRNWREYEAGLKRRGDLTLWLDEAAMAGWQAPPRSTPGGQAWYSDLAIELVLTLRLVFHLALRQAEGFAVGVLRGLGQDLRVPDHTTWSRRGRGFAGRRPGVGRQRPRRRSLRRRAGVPGRRGPPARSAARRRRPAARI